MLSRRPPGSSLRLLGGLWAIQGRRLTRGTADFRENIATFILTADESKPYNNVKLNLPVIG